jgi:type VI secretion system protein ImpA
MPINAELLKSLLAPISESAPSGRYVRYEDPGYAAVEEAQHEDPDLPTGGLATQRKLADWPKTVALITQLLQKDTKDVQLAAWLIEALFRRQGYGGLTTGLEAMKGLLETFWDTIHPEVDTTDPDLDPEEYEIRAGPLRVLGKNLELPVWQTPVTSNGLTHLDYIASRGIPTEAEAEDNKEKRALRKQALDDGKVPPEEVDAAVAATPKAFYKTVIADVDGALASLAALEAVSDKRFTAEPPSYRQLRAALDDVRRTAALLLAEKLKHDPDPVEEAPSEEFGSYAPPAGWSADGAGGDGTLPIEPTSTADAAQRVAAAAAYLRKQDPASPAPYLLLRGLRWGELRANGGDVSPKLLEAPPTPVRARLKSLLLDGRWPELLEQAEGVMAAPYGRGWLDLQRYVVTACEHLGGSHDAVAAAVTGALRTLLAALPTLPEMTLMDDTPTANAETRAWLDAQAIAPRASLGTPAAGGGGDDALPDGGDALDAALVEDGATAEHGGLVRARARRPAAAAPDPFLAARAELTQGRANRAIELLVAELARERSPRGRFVRQTQIAYVMVEAGLDEVAQPILEDLVDIINEHEKALEKWEAGPLVAQPMALLCKVLDRTKSEREKRHDRDELYQRVCRLDPLQAMALGRGA